MKHQVPQEKNKKFQLPVKPEPIAEKAFNAYCVELGMRLQPMQLNALRPYTDALMLWNTRINLVGTLMWKECLAELIIDSYYLAQCMQELHLPENCINWDLGAGAGLPGIPLRILWQEGHYTLVEAREKRALFMTQFLLKNPLPRTQVAWQRAETFFQKQNQKAHCIISRAFMPYEELLEFVLPYVENNGYVLLMQNEMITQVHGWRIEKSIPYTVYTDEGKQKIAHTRYFHVLTRG